MERSRGTIHLVVGKEVFNALWLSMPQQVSYIPASFCCERQQSLTVGLEGVVASAILTAVCKDACRQGLGITGNRTLHTKKYQYRRETMKKEDNSQLHTW